MDWRRFSIIALVIAIMFGTVVLIGGRRNSALVIITSMLASTIAVATPLTLGALSGIYCERAGVVNIGIEGMMLGAAFFGWLASIYMNTVFGEAPMLSLLVGVLVAILTGALFALLHAVLSITFKVDQIIGGTVINILAAGITGFLNRQMFFGAGSVFGGQVPHSPGVLPTIHVPFLADIPVVGRIFQQQPIAISALLLVLITHFVLFYTRWGLRTRAVGEHPRAADTVGINVDANALCQRAHRRLHGGTGRGLLHPGIHFIVRAPDDQRTRLHCPGGHDLWQLDTVRRLGGRARFWRGAGSANQFAILQSTHTAVTWLFYRIPTWWVWHLIS